MADDRFVGGGGGGAAAAPRQHGGGGGAEQHRLLMLHHQQLSYHVPQHSRREKLRFPVDESPPLLCPAGNNSLTAAAFLPSSSSSTTSSSFQFDARGEVVPSPHAQQHQIPGGGQGFSLSLASPHPPAPRPLLATRPPAPLGPFTGYAAVLSRSRFLEPARKLLEEVCGGAAPGHAAAGSGGGDEAREMLLEADPARESAAADHGVEQQWRKTRLISMLDEVYRRYKQYYQQVQAVITSFESVAGLSNAAPFASTALRVMTKHFRCMKNSISGQLWQTAAKGPPGNSGLRNQESISGFGLLNGGAGYQLNHLIRTASNAGPFTQPHAWRPQRGLPERAVSVLRAWLFDHFLHPYPTDVDKQNLAKQTGLTRNQVSNWFINARVRLWKPMVEEVHTLEMRKKNKTSGPAAAPVDENGNSDEQLLRPPPPSSSKTGNPFDCHQQFQIARAQSSQYPAGPRGGGERSTGGTVGGNSVTLTLGLHQNGANAGGRVCFPELRVDPINVARRFGLEECAVGEQEKQFGGKEENGRMLRDFVG